MKTILAPGCFDVIHRGHIELLNFAKSLGGIGDCLIVGLNSDESVKKLKGPDRPVNCENDRRFVLQNLKAVDEVIIFNEETPVELIKRINADIVVKGGDYNPNDIIESQYAEVVCYDYLNGYSSTKIINTVS